MNNLETLEEYLETTDLTLENEYEILKTFKNTIGYKIEWPLKCLKMNEININIHDYLRGQKYNFMADYTENYYKLFSDTIINRPDINIAINRVIKRFNSIFIK